MMKTMRNFVLVVVLITVVNATCVVKQILTANTFPNGAVVTSAMEKQITNVNGGSLIMSNSLWGLAGYNSFVEQSIYTCTDGSWGYNWTRGVCAHQYAIAFPSIIYGIEVTGTWPSTAPELPVQLKNIQSYVVDMDITHVQTGSGLNDFAYDIWWTNQQPVYGKSVAGSETDEIMIWYSWSANRLPGYKYAQKNALVVNGVSYDYGQTAPMHYWKIHTFLVSGAHVVPAQVDLKPFFDFVANVNGAYTNGNIWLTSIQFGDEAYDNTSGSCYFKKFSPCLNCAVNPTGTPTKTPTTKPATPAPTTAKVPTAKPTPIPSTTSEIIYADAASSEWTVAYSWGTKNIAETTVVHSGTTAMSLGMQVTSALVLYASTTLATSAYTSLVFYINGGSLTKPNVLLQVEAPGSVIQANVNLNKYVAGGYIPTNKWAKVIVPASVFNTKTFLFFNIESAAPWTTGGLVYVDDVSLTLSTPTVGNPVNSMLAIYTGGDVTQGWSDYGWGAYNLTDPTFSHTGDASISLDLSDDNGVSLYSEAVVSTSGLSSLVFWVNGGSLTNPMLNLEVNYNATVTATLSVNDYVQGSTIPSDSWAQVTIPVSDLGTDLIQYFTIVPATAASGSVYLDDFSFVTNGEYNPFDNSSSEAVVVVYESSSVESSETSIKTGASVTSTTGDSSADGSTSTSASTTGVAQSTSSSASAASSSSAASTASSIAATTGQVSNQVSQGSCTLVVSSLVLLLAVLAAF